MSKRERTIEEKFEDLEEQYQEWAEQYWQDVKFKFQLENELSDEQMASLEGDDNE